MGKVGNFIFSAGTIYGHVQDDQNPLISFEVYECPACRCQVLYKGTREYGTTRWEKVDVISYCMGDA